MLLGCLLSLSLSLSHSLFASKFGFFVMLIIIYCKFVCWWCLFCQNGKELFNFNIIYVMCIYVEPAKDSNYLMRD